MRLPYYVTYVTVTLIAAFGPATRFCKTIHKFIFTIICDLSLRSSFKMTFLIHILMFQSLIFHVKVFNHYFSRQQIFWGFLYSLKVIFFLRVKFTIKSCFWIAKNLNIEILCLITLRNENKIKHRVHNSNWIWNV